MEQEKKNFYRFLIKKNDKIPIGIIRLGFLFLYHFLFFSINSSTQYYAYVNEINHLVIVYKTEKNPLIIQYQICHQSI